MKINSLKINGFGKMNNKEMEFSDGINIISGKNESGKTTLLKFITSMFYGTSRNKNGKVISDFERYKPWGKEDYSGRLEYELDNGKKYEIYREFKKKSPDLYDENRNEISKNYKIETTKGNLFFIEQTGVQEENFFASCITEQENIRISDNTKNSLIQKLGNIVSSGNENVSYRIAMDRLTRKQTAEVGNNRTSGRPLNIVEEELKHYENKKLQLEKYKDEKYRVDNKKESIQSDINNNNVILDLLRYQKVNLEKISVEEEKNKIFEQDIEKEKQNREEILSKGNFINEEKNNNYKISKFKYILCFISAIIISIISITIKIPVLLFLNIFPIIILIIVRIVENKKKKEIQRKKKKNYQEKSIFESELSKIENAIKDKEKQLKEKKEIIENTYKEIENNTKIQFKDKVDIETIEDILSTKYEKIVEFIDEKEREQANYKVKEKTIEVDNEQIIKKLDELVEIDEKIEQLTEKREKLIKLNNIYDLVKEELDNSFKEIKNNITPEFINELKNIVKIATKGKYENIFLDSENNILIETEDGRYMPIYMMSTGTIDLIYLALRISAAKEISKENMPIILDESFAYYDNERITESLKYLSRLVNRQIIIFTCSNREKEILDNEKIKYHFIEI